jgi:hypothetical protein
MVGERRRRELADTARQVVDKIGVVGTAALTLAGSMLIMALAVLVLAFRGRRPA